MSEELKENNIVDNEEILNALFDYIKESVINGAFEQVLELYTDLDDIQKAKFNNYCIYTGNLEILKRVLNIYINKD